MSVKITGVDVLVKELKKQASLQDVKNAVKMNTANLQKQAMRKAPVDTGNLKRSITIDILDGGHTGKVTATADYSIYQEYGTRFMSAQPFMRPSLSIIEPQFRKDLERLMK